MPAEEKHRGTRLPELDAALVEARVLVMGVLSQGLLHEYANLITILDGQRQIEELKPTSASFHDLVEPLDRSRRLIEAYRRVSAGPSEGLIAGDVTEELDCLSLLLRARLKGRKSVISVREGPEQDRDHSMAAEWSGSCGRLCFLLALLATIQLGAEGEGWPARVDLLPAPEPAVIEARVYRADGNDGQMTSSGLGETMLGSARKLAMLGGGKLSVSEEGGYTRVVVGEFRRESLQHEA